ncbi:MAG: AAA family ATPase [Erysipelotrichaceae bacterium]
MELYEIENTLEQAEDNCLMIGRLRYNGVFPMKNADHVMLFDIDLLCDEPKVIRRNKALFTSDIYQGLDQHQLSNQLPVDYDRGGNRGTLVEDRMQEFKDFYQDKYIFFLPDLASSANEQLYHKNLIIIESRPIPLGTDINTIYKAIPKINLTKEVFENKLIKKEYFTLSHFPGDLYNNLEYILCENYLYQAPKWNANHEDINSWKCEDYTKVVRYPIELKENYAQRGPTGYQDIVFIDEEKLREIAVEGETIEKKDGLIVNNDKKQVEEERLIVLDVNNQEFKMLEDLKYNITASNLCYDDEDIDNLHVCIKSTPLTILAGMSGTGKTQLALQYAQMLNLKESNNDLLFLPISPSYTEPEDVLGYLNPNNGMYTPAATQLVDLLLRAQNNTDKMFMVIFDEMNLSQIEYWFSPFISILEKKSNDRRLTLYSQATECKNKKDYPAQIQIYDNIIFIGTINLDETTKDISDRLLDRSFVINLKKKKFSDFYNQHNKKELKDIKLMNVCTGSKMFNKTWKSAKNPIEAFSQREIEFLDLLHEAISIYDEQKGVSFRVIKNIGTYINNIPINSDGELLIDRSHAFDLVLKQTVMKKLSGPETILAPLVGTCSNLKEEPTNSSINELFSSYSDVSDFANCKAAINAKAKDLLVYGYTR